MNNLMITITINNDEMNSMMNNDDVERYDEHWSRWILITGDDFDFWFFIDRSVASVSVSYTINDVLNVN